MTEPKKDSEPPEAEADEDLSLEKEKILDLDLAEEEGEQVKGGAVPVKTALVCSWA